GRTEELGHLLDDQVDRVLEAVALGQALLEVRDVLLNRGRLLAGRLGDEGEELADLDGVVADRLDGRADLRLGLVEAASPPGDESVEGGRGCRRRLVRDPLGRVSERV